MRSSTGGEQLEQFEGLVRATARMFASQVGMDTDDLAQELRVRVWRAAESWRPERGTTLEAYVYSAVANKVKDKKRDAARERKRQHDAGLTFLHIEDMRLSHADTDSNGSQQETFDGLFHHIDHDEVYGEVDTGKFVLPAGVTERESHVLLCLMMQMSKTETALRLGVSRAEVYAVLTRLQEKFADWKPELGANLSQLVAAA